MGKAGVAAVLDIACVVIFVVIGRASHAQGETLAGIASTCWPFLAGLAAGWLASRAWRRPLALFPAGTGAWLGTVAAGMALRVLAGQGTAAAFIGVALAFLGLFLLGWRLVARLARRRQPQPAGDADQPLPATAGPAGRYFGVGAVAVRGSESRRRHPSVAVAYGSGLALIVDEFALPVIRKVHGTRRDRRRQARGR